MSTSPHPSAELPKSRLTKPLTIVVLWSVLVWLLAARSAIGLFIYFSALTACACAARGRRFRSSFIWTFAGCGAIALGSLFGPPWRGILSFLLGPALLLLGSADVLITWSNRRFGAGGASEAQTSLTFTLRTLMLFVTLVCITFSWLGLEAHRAGRQRAAVQAICELGGRVVYAYWSDAPPGQGVNRGKGEVLSVYGKRFWPAWLEKLVGHDFFDHVKTVTVTTDAQVERCKALSRLESLELRGPEIADDVLRHVGELTQLRYLDLVGCPITDAGLGYLRKLKYLRSLQLSDTAVTEAGIQRLQQALPGAEVYERHGGKNKPHPPRR